MKTSNLFYTLIFLLFNSLVVCAQSSDNKEVANKNWDLNSCINYAIAHNIQLKQMSLQVKSSKSYYGKSKASLLPSLNARGSYSSNRGRSIDPTTNDFTDSEFSSINASIYGSVTLFNGLRQFNTIRRDKFNLLASLAELDERKYNINLQVAVAYLQILLDNELFELSENQLKTTDLQVIQTGAMLESGKLAKGSLLEIEAQQANEYLDKITAENNLKTSYLNLKQLLELDTNAVFEIHKPDIQIAIDKYTIDNTDEVFEKSMNLPAIKKQNYTIESLKKSMLIAKGGISPVVTLSASYGSYYSSRSVNPKGGDYLFGDQFSNNLNLVISLNVNIPIFNGLTVKNNISQSKIALENSKYQLDIVKNNLYKDIQKANSAAQSALAKYNASRKSVESQREAFEHAKQKFNLGLISSVDYNIAKNRLIKSELNMIQSKYDFIFRINILNFYQGIPFEL